MTQTNKDTQKKREIRRRPKFVSRQDVLQQVAAAKLV